MSSARRFSGKPEDYIEIHEWFDETKAGLADVRHRAMRHHAEGIKQCMKYFGPWITVLGPDNKFRNVSVRMVAEQHVLEDLGKIPTMADWLREMPVKPWMVKRAMSRPDKLKLRAGDKEGSYDPIAQLKESLPSEETQP